MMPEDPIILLSFVNTQLRDNFDSLDAFCKAFETDKTGLMEKLGELDYHYDEAANRFT